MSEYLRIKKVIDLPRLPLEGSIDLTYRCNNNCLHCWLRIPQDDTSKKDELSFEEIKRIVDEARSMGCRSWNISGGEPMLRHDFAEIFNYITQEALSYTLNTNGTLITPKIAKLLKKRGTKLVSLYGATPDVHDHITQSPGSFEATLRGIAYLKENGVTFTVLLTPLKDNYYQFNKMIELAKSLSKHYKLSSCWLYLSAYGDARKNREIRNQRLSPQDVIKLDEPDICYEESRKEISDRLLHSKKQDRSFFYNCINKENRFRIDPYGKMTFCYFIKDPTLQYDLRKGKFTECWNNFIPSLKNIIKQDEEYLKNCGSCTIREDCRWCAVYAYLEHRRYSAKIKYLCEIARENKKFKEKWIKNHRRYYKIAEITIQIDSDLPIDNNTFHNKFKLFEVDNPGKDIIKIKHCFTLPSVNKNKLGKKLYSKPPWMIYKKGDSWIYLGITPGSMARGDFHQIAVFNHNHTQARIYNSRKDKFLEGNLGSLTLLPTDQILLARVLADKKGCILHACGVNFNGNGYLFIGHSTAGKSTIALMLKKETEILCDDRMIVRKHFNDFKIYASWSYGEIPKLSTTVVPLRKIFFLEKSDTNRITLINNKRECFKRLIAHLIRPFVTVDWWEKVLFLIEDISNKTPCYILQFDKSGEIVKMLKR